MDQPQEKTIEQRIHEKNVSDYLKEVKPLQEKYNVRPMAVLEYLPHGVTPIIIYIDRKKHDQMIKNLQGQQ